MLDPSYSSERSTSVPSAGRISATSTSLWADPRERHFASSLPLLSSPPPEPERNPLRSRRVQRLARDIYKEVIEFKSVNIGGGTTDVANALAKRFRDAGFPEEDIFLGGVQPNTSACP
jgi:hypothetical protein